MNRKEFLRQLNSGNMDKETCIQYFTKLAENEVVIYFSTKLVASLFKHKHDYIFKHLFDHGILYFTYYYKSALYNLSKKHMQSASLVYAFCYPKLLLKDYSLNQNNKMIYKIYYNLSNELLFDSEKCLDDNFVFPNNYSYNQEQKQAIKHIKSIYNKLCFYNFYKSGKFHPYSIYSIATTCDANTIEYFIEKLNFFIDDIEKIKKFIFLFKPIYLPQTHYSAFIDFLSEKNKLSFDHIHVPFLSNKKYYNYCLKNGYTIPYYHFQIGFVEDCIYIDYKKFAHRIINLHGQDNDLIYNTVYSITDNILLEHDDNLEFYSQLLMKIFNSNENIFIDFFNNFVNKNINFYQKYSNEEIFKLFLKLYQNDHFYTLFFKHFEKIQLISEITDFLFMRDNISNF